MIPQQVGVADATLQDVHRLVPWHVAHLEHAAGRWSGSSVDRHPDASLGSFVWWLKCRDGRGLPVPFPKLLRVWGNDWLRERLGLTADG